MKRIRKRHFVKTILIVSLALLLAFSACAAPMGSSRKGDLMAGIQPRSSSLSMQDVDSTAADASAEFGLKLLRASMEEGGNVLVSPLSVLSALTMTAHGAQGDTLAQMEQVLGLPVGQLSEYLAAYSGNLPSGEKYRFHQANSLWLKEGAVEVEKDLLQKNAYYLGAGFCQEPFDDATVQKVNDWVKEHTHGMIPRMLGELSPQAVMVLLNALAFEGEWAHIYEEQDVREGTFTLADGSTKPVDMMFSWEYGFLQDGEAVGFLKYYTDRKYAFAALLPGEGQSLEDYAATLTGQRLRQLLAEPEEREVWANLPKFETEYSASLSDTLRTLGMMDAFDPDKADFSPMGRAADGWPLYIGDVLHKTYISVFEQGTKAGAATAVVMEAGAAMMDEPARVDLDRPFLYMIVDTETFTPIFLGAMQDPGSGQ